MVVSPFETVKRPSEIIKCHIILFDSLSENNSGLSLEVDNPPLFSDKLPKKHEITGFIAQIEWIFVILYRVVKPRAYAVPNPEKKQRDPVHLYKVFRSKRPEEMCLDTSPFFLTPGGKKHKCWFRKSSMGINTLYGIMNKMKEDAGIENPRITPYRYVYC